MIIDIEGTDGSGKKTQTDLLLNYLKEKGYSVIKISFPNYESNSSALVKMYLNGDFGEHITGYQASAFYAVDRFATMSKINVDDYDFVLFDRYVPSNMIHQSIKIKDKKILDEFLDWICDFEYEKLKLPRPDVTLFLDLPVEYSLKLIASRGALKNGQSKDILESKENQQLAYNNAKYVAEKYGWTSINCVNNEIKTIDEIHKEILTKLGV